MPVVSTISKHLSYLTPKRDKPQAQINLIVGELIATVLQALCTHSRGMIHESLTEAKYPLMHSCTVNGCTWLKSLYSLYLLHIIHSSLKYEVLLFCMVRESLLCCTLMPKAEPSWGICSSDKTSTWPSYEPSLHLSVYASLAWFGPLSSCSLLPFPNSFFAMCLHMPSWLTHLPIPKNTLHHAPTYSFTLAALTRSVQPDHQYDRLWVC